VETVQMMDWGSGVGRFLGALAQAKQREQDLALQRGWQQLEQMHRLYGTGWASQHPEDFRRTAEMLQSASRPPQGFFSTEFGAPTIRFPHETITTPGQVLTEARPAEVLPSGLARAEGVSRLAAPAQAEVRGPATTSERIAVPGGFDPSLAFAGVTFKPGREAAAKQRAAVLAGQGIPPDKWFQDPVIKDSIEPSRTSQQYTNEFQTRVADAQKRIDALNARIQTAASNNPSVVSGLIAERDRQVALYDRSLGEHANRLNEMGIPTKYQGLTVGQVDEKALTAGGRLTEDLKRAHLTLAQVNAAKTKVGTLSADERQVLSLWRSPNFMLMPKAQQDAMLVRVAQVMKKLGINLTAKDLSATSADTKAKAPWQNVLDWILSRVPHPAPGQTAPPATPAEEPTTPDDDLSDLYNPP
jgi:hypothetical protein